MADKCMEGGNAVGRGKMEDGHWWEAIVEGWEERPGVVSVQPVQSWWVEEATMVSNRQYTILLGKCSGSTYHTCTLYIVHVEYMYMVYSSCTLLCTCNYLQSVSCGLS